MEYDERELFKSTAWYYSRFRSGYPPELFVYLKHYLPLRATGRLLDLGCGTGEICLPLASQFQEVVGMDPEPQMLEEAQRKATKKGVLDINWIKGGSTDLRQFEKAGRLFDMVTMGSSFHWMDRDATLLMLDKIVQPKGLVVVVSSGSSIWDPQTDWKAVVKTVLMHHLGEKRRAGKGFYTTSPERHEIVLARSPFSQIEVWNYTYQRTVTIDEILGFLYSTSFASSAILGDRKPKFEEDLRKSLLSLETTGIFFEKVDVESLIAIRPF